MAYGLKYWYEFNDGLYNNNAVWRIELLKKDYTGSSDRLSKDLGARPLTFQRAAESEDKRTSIIGTKATVTYIVDGEPNTPLPEEFIDTEEDTYQLFVYKDGISYFKGFLKPDAISYEWVAGKYPVTINATDYFNKMKGEKMSITQFLNVPDDPFYYHHISIFDVLNRTLFKALNYDETAVVKVMFNIRPESIPDDPDRNLFIDMFIHTDAFYTLDNGADSSYDALDKLLKALGCRIFYSDGAYWIQRIQEIGRDTFRVFELRTNNPFGPSYIVSNPRQIIPTDVKFASQAAGIDVEPAIYQQKNVYELKAINQLRNFKWDVFNAGEENPVGEFTGPNATTALGVFRFGSGTVEDPYFLTMSGGSGDPSLGETIFQNIFPANNLRAGQYVQIDLKANIFWSAGLEVQVTIIPSTGGGPTYTLDSGGKWDNISNPVITVGGDKKTRKGTLSVTSQPIPRTGDNYNLLFSIIGPRPANDPNDPLPAGQTVRNDVYPAFVRIFNNLVTSIEATITNARSFSKKGSDDDVFFTDLSDPNLSNCFYRNDGGNYIPLPLNDWINPGYEENLFDPSGIVEDLFVSNTGAITPGAGWKLIRIPVSAGDVYTFGKINISTGGYSAFYEIDGSTMTGFNGPFSTGQTVTVTAPAGSAYLIIDIKRPADTDEVYKFGTVNEGDTLMTVYHPFIGQISIDEYLGRLTLDQYNTATSKVQGRLLSNKIEFFQGLTIQQMGKKFMHMSSDYDVKSGTNNVILQECKEENTGLGTYQTISITK